MPRIPGEKKPTGISCVFSEAGLTLLRVFFIVSSFGLLYLKCPFSFLSLHPIVLCLHLELQLTFLCLPLGPAFVPFTALLHVHRNTASLC